MKPEDRKRLKQHIEMIVEHKEPEDEIANLREKNIKLRLELSTLRFKESQENRFVWWIYNVYSRNVCDMIYAIMGATTYDTEDEAKDGKYALPKECFDLMKRIDEYTEHIYDGTYLDVEMSADVKNTNPDYYNQPSNSDVSMTQDVLINNKTTNSIETVEEKEIKSLRAENERLISENEITGFELRRFSDFISALSEIKNAGCDFRLESDTDGKGDHIFTMTIIEQNNNVAGTGWSIKHQSTQDNIFDAVYLARAALEAK